MTRLTIRFPRQPHTVWSQGAVDGLVGQTCTIEGHPARVVAAKLLADEGVPLVTFETDLSAGESARLLAADEAQRYSIGFNT